MSIPKKIREFLDSHKVWYQFCTHSPAYTAQGLAHVQHVSGKELAKVVMVVADKRMVMTVLSGSHRVEVDQLHALLNCQNCRLATEEEFKDLFPDCEVGAMPPFGNLYGMKVYVTSNLADEKEIAFNAGVHTEVIKLAYEDFERLVQPTVLDFVTN